MTNTKILNTFWAENFTRFENRYLYGGTSTQLYWWQLPEFYDTTAVVSEFKVRKLVLQICDESTAVGERGTSTAVPLEVVQRRTSWRISTCIRRGF